MRTYSLVDRATGEEVEVDSSIAEQLTGVEIVDIEWAIEQLGKSVNRVWFGQKAYQSFLNALICANATCLGIG